MLDEVIVPGGARRVAHAPGTRLGVPAQSVVCNPLIDDARYWLVPGSPATLVAFLGTHVPVGMAKSGNGALTSGGVVRSYDVVDAPANQKVVDDSVVFTLAAVGPHSTGLRIDAMTVPTGADCMSGGGMSGGGMSGGGTSSPGPARP
jgi:hypothetical protein